MATKTKKSAPKKWSPPKGWDADVQENVIAPGKTEPGDLFTGTRTYEDGTVREFVAHSQEEFDTLAEANDADVARRAQQPE